MSTESPVRFAILGCGGISQAHFRSVMELENTELVAVCDKNEELAKQKSEEYGVTYFTSYEDMLQQDDIEAICICTPSGMHAEQTIQAARAGKHVVCEKPMAITLDDQSRMTNVCAEEGVKLTTIFPRRMSPAARYVRKLIQEGRLGKLSLCSAFAKFYRDQAYYDSAGWRGTWAMDGGGAMMNQGIHTIDLLQWLVGPVKSLFGRADAVLRNIEVEDTAAISLQFENGAFGVMEMTTTAYKQPSHQISIIGDKGTIIMTGDEITTLEIVGEEVTIPEFPAFKTVPDGHRIQISDMAQAIREDRPPIVTGEDGRHSLEIILGTYDSSQKGHEVRFK